MSHLTTASCQVDIPDSSTPQYIATEGNRSFDYNPYSLPKANHIQFEANIVESQRPKHSKRISACMKFCAGPNKTSEKSIQLKNSCLSGSGIIAKPDVVLKKKSFLPKIEVKKTNLMLQKKGKLSPLGRTPLREVLIVDKNSTRRKYSYFLITNYSICDRE